MFGELKRKVRTTKRNNNCSERKEGVLIMIKRNILVLSAAAGLFAFAPAAHAFHGNLVKCTAAPGITGVATISPGFTCTDAVHKIGVATSIKKGTNFTCTEATPQNPAAPWATWASVKWDKTGAVTITAADVALKAIAYGSCNFGAPVTDPAAGANGAGSVTFYNGTTKVASSSYFGHVAGDAATFSAKTEGVVTKGMGIGATIIVQSVLDGTDPNTAAAFACTAGSLCGSNPNPYAPKGMASCAGKVTDPTCCDSGCIAAGNPKACCSGPGAGLCTAADAVGSCVDGKTLGLTTTGGNSLILIQIPSNADCTGNNTPLPCCSGPLAGNC